MSQEAKMGNKPKLHDGYTVRGGIVTFYKDSAFDKAVLGKRPKVDQDKVMEYEGLCEKYRNNFTEIGWLILHTPIAPHEEELGTNFLSVPVEHRARIASMIKGGTLIMLDRLKTFRVLESGEQFTFEHLLGGGELFDFLEIAQENREKLDRGEITKEEWERRLKTIDEWEKTKFHIERFSVVNMFAEI
jgi:hypothetical protein